MARWQDAPVVQQQQNRWQSAPAVQEQRERQFVGPPAPATSRVGLVKDAAIGLTDIGISAARGLVNKPAQALSGIEGALVGAIDPTITARQGWNMYRDEGRRMIDEGRAIIGSEQLRTPQGRAISERFGQRVAAAGLPKAMQAIDSFASRLPPNLAMMVSPMSTLERVAGPEAREVVESAAMLAGMRTPRLVGRPGVPSVTPPGTQTEGVMRRLGLVKDEITPEQVVARSTDGGSAGASAAATNVADASPELRQAIVRSGGRSGQINNEVLSRHMEADTLPAPIRLTEGEATQNPLLISQERNLRGKHPQMVERMNETNKRLGENLQVLRDQVGPEVFSTNVVEHGDTLIRAYKRLDAAAEAEVNGLYRQVRESMGSGVPVDAGAILQNATTKLHERLLYDHAPPAEMATLTRLAQSRNMTFENFEALRTNLARIARSNADGNVKAAAGIIRNALEDLPLFPGSGAERMKPIADAARAAARRRFQAMEADPAYDAAINGTVSPDRFVQRFVLGGTRDDLDLMMRTLGDSPDVKQTVSVATLDHLRDAARLDPNYSGNFSSAGFSRALQGLDAKANIIFDPRTVENLGKLRNVANYTTFQPRGSFVNNSNTLVASAANYGMAAAEGATNFAFKGLPVGTVARRGLEALGTRRTINRALRPGAGIDAPRNALARPPAPNALNQPKP